MDEAAGVAEFTISDRQTDGDAPANDIERSIEVAIDLVSAYVSNNHVDPDRFLSLAEQTIDMVARKLGTVVPSGRVHEVADRINAAHGGPGGERVAGKIDDGEPSPAGTGGLSTSFEATAREKGWRDPDHPAVPPNKSVTPDAIICLFDGKPYKTLKKHIRQMYGMSPEQYRAYWHLPPDYPMVSQNYSTSRSQLAQKQGFGSQPNGRRRRQAAA